MKVEGQKIDLMRIIGLLCHRQKDEDSELQLTGGENKQSAKEKTIGDFKGCFVI